MRNGDPRGDGLGFARPQLTANSHNMPMPSEPISSVNPAHRELLRSAWKNAECEPIPFPLDGSLDDLSALDHFHYEGLLDYLPNDNYHAVASVWADVVIRRLRFQPDWQQMSSERMLVLRHEGARAVIMPWPRVYEAMHTQYPQFGRLTNLYLQTVVLLAENPFGPPLGVDHPIHPMHDMLFLDPSAYPASIVQLMRQIHERWGWQAIFRWELEPYEWGTRISWESVQRELARSLGSG